MSRAPMGRSKLRRSGNIESRIAQLEELQRPRDEILVVWRRPGVSLSQALGRVEYGPGDRVVCFEWLGKGQPPQPQWRGDLRNWSKEENDSIDIMLKRIIDASPNRERTAGTELTAHAREELERCSDEELLYAVFGVPDGRLFRDSLSR